MPAAAWRQKKIFPAVLFCSTEKSAAPGNAVMIKLIIIYWPYILALLSLILGLAAAIHAIMTKEEVRTAIGWVGVIILSPVLGAVIYGIIGVNRIRRKTINIQRRKMSGIEQCHLHDYDMPVQMVKKSFGQHGVSMKHLGDRVSSCAQTSGNTIEILSGGDKTYGAMLRAIAKAQYSIFLETYIFDDDAVGREFVRALADAVGRGVAVRVLIDAVGARYSFPSIVHILKKKGVPVGIFNGNIIIGLRLPYANLRTHRKILVIDGKYAFTGGMNIREGFSAMVCGGRAFYDTHFRVEGPAVQDLFQAGAQDWAFSSGEKLNTKPWVVSAPVLKSGKGMAVRVIPSGPIDSIMEANQRMLIGAFSVAQQNILLKTPYLLPDRELVSALVTAARRGVKVDIVVPGHNNLRLVNRAMRAQFDQLLRDNCHIWRAYGPFDHSKLVSIDDYWAYVGSSNIDPRSLRLNFEIDLEIMDRKFAKAIAGEINRSLSNADKVTLPDLRKQPFTTRLKDRFIWLGSPYL